MKNIIYLLTILIQTNLIGQTIETNPITIGEKLSIYSEILKEKREIYIYEPAGFWGLDEEMKNLPVVYVLDGESQFLNTVSTIDYLSSAPEGNDVLPRCLIVGIPNTNRNRDLTPIKGMLGNDPSTLEVTGGGPEFLEFITLELIPFIDKKYNTCNHRTLIGHSLGGILTIDALLKKREYFNNYVAIDPALGFGEHVFFEEILDTLSNSNLSDENIFIGSANNRPGFLSLEELKNDSSDFMLMVDAPNQELLKLSASKDWQINLLLKYYEDENHFSVPHRTTYDAMKFFFGFYRFKGMTDYSHPDFSNKTDLMGRIKRHYQKISDKMGCEFIPMEGYLNSWAFGLGHAKRNDLAMDLFKYNIELYPDRPTVYSSLGYYYRNKNNHKQAIVQFDKSLELKHDENILEIRNQTYKKMTSNNHMSKVEENYKSVENIWSAYLKENPDNLNKQSPSSFYFCDNEKDANECAELVVKGIKQATATSLWWYQKNKEQLPKIGDQYVITDWDGNAKAIIETTKVEQVPYNEITAEFAATEGEGDKSLKYWKEVHEAYYKREMEPLGDKFSEEMLIVCEYFKTIYVN